MSPRDLCCHGAGSGAGLVLVSARARSTEHELRLSFILGLTRSDVFCDCCTQREYLSLNRNIKAMEVTSQGLLAGDECCNKLFVLLKLCC